jgi:hypothetical protein
MAGDLTRHAPALGARQFGARLIGTTKSQRWHENNWRAVSPMAKLQTETLTISGILNSEDTSQIGALYWHIAKEVNGDLMVAPESFDKKSINRETLEVAPFDDDGLKHPTTPEDAKRWCIFVDELESCDPKTAFIIYFSPVHGEMPVIRQIDGPCADEHEGRSILARKLEIREHTAPLKPANDNTPLPRQSGYPGIVTSAELIKGFTPPDYQIDGIVQKGFIYSMTAATGTGKTAVLLLLSALTALGEPLGEREVRKGRVVYFAGENPDDVTMRWIAASHHLPFDAENIDVHFIKGTFHIAQMFERIKQDVERLGGVDLVVIDTSAAYFNGSDENSNTELGNHARDLRTLTTLDGHPCVMVACHPTKNATTENLLPRGGSAFLAEVDGNLVCVKMDGGVRLHTQGKHRGPDFEPIDFALETVTAPQLKDTRGRDVPTVMAKPLGPAQVRAKAASARRDEDDALMALETNSNQSLANIAESLGWIKEGTAHKDRARRATDKLKKSKLLEFKGRKWHVTTLGHDAIVDIRAKRHEEQMAAKSAAKLVSKSTVRTA